MPGHLRDLNQIWTWTANWVCHQFPGCVLHVNYDHRWSSRKCVVLSAASLSITRVHPQPIPTHKTFFFCYLSSCDVLISSRRIFFYFLINGHCCSGLLTPGVGSLHLAVCCTRFSFADHLGCDSQFSCGSLRWQPTRK